MIAAVVIAGIAIGYFAGRLHGKAAHHRKIADGFYWLSDQSFLDGTAFDSIDKPCVTPRAVSQAFGHSER